MNKFVHPSTILISGPTGSGKTEIAMKLFFEKRFAFPKMRLDGGKNSGRPDRTIWIYGQWQHLYDTFREIARISPEITGDLEFHEELDPAIIDSLNENENNFLVLDDQMTRLNNNPILTRIFSEASHHRNLTVMMLVQNLYTKGKEMTTVSRNTHYLIATKNSRDMGAISKFMQQISHDNWKSLVAAYKDATKEPFSHCKVNLRSDHNDDFMLSGSALCDDCAIYVLPNVKVNAITRYLDQDGNEVKGENEGETTDNHDEVRTL